MEIEKIILKETTFNINHFENGGNGLYNLSIGSDDRLSFNNSQGMILQVLLDEQAIRILNYYDNDHDDIDWIDLEEWEQILIYGAFMYTLHEKCNVFSRIEQVANGLNWKVEHDTIQEEIDFTFYQTSPQGMDFGFSVSINEKEYSDEELIDKLANAIYRYWENFDVSEEAYVWLDETGHGKNGAPSDMKDVYEDVEFMENEIRILEETIRTM